MAALVYGPELDTAPILAKVADLLQARGVKLAGAVQHNDGSCSMTLEILPGGPQMLISQPLGEGAKGCRLNTNALAEAAGLIRRAIESSPQLVLFNKFGTQEAAGCGLRDEMAAAALSGLPLLTAVSESLLPEWSTFTGGGAVRLPCSVEAAIAWWDSLPGNR
jgi:hypothetical protein